MMSNEVNLIKAQQLALLIRKHVLRMTHRKGSHIGSCYSIADLIAVLYSHGLRVDPERPQWPDRDRFILSKGHGCAALYAALAERGFFPRFWLDSFYQNGALLASHATHWGVPGVEASTGSLGHGLALACGMAVAGKKDTKSYRVFALLSDGECDEGSTWEAALFAPFHHLDNLVTIIDYNKIQSLGRVKEVLDLEPLVDKWKAFGWVVREINGHNFDEIDNTLMSVPFETGKPSCVIAHTIKGKGVSFMEDQLLWHYRAPDDEEFEKASLELERNR
jgi:transketolase